MSSQYLISRKQFIKLRFFMLHTISMAFAERRFLKTNMARELFFKHDLTNVSGCCHNYAVNYNKPCNVDRVV